VRLAYIFPARERCSKKVIVNTIVEVSLCGTCVSEACGWVEFDPFSSCMMGQVEGGADGNVLG
jgi:hypothetical protein